MKKQTAVEWLHDTWGNYPDSWSWELIQKWFAKAKAMEKEQIEEAYDEGKFDQYYYTAKEPEQYYNETYNTDTP